MEQLTDELAELVVVGQAVTFGAVEEGQELVTDAPPHPAGGLTSTELIPKFGSGVVDCEGLEYCCILCGTKVEDQFEPCEAVWGCEAEAPW